MALDYKRIVTDLELLQRVPTISMRRGVDGQSFMLPKDQAIQLETAILADLETEVNKFKREYLKKIETPEKPEPPALAPATAPAAEPEKPKQPDAARKPRK